MPICQPTGSPNFTQIVDKTIALFAIYTGATLSFFVKDFLFSDNNLKTIHGLYGWSHYWGSWVVLAVVALLLRYIVGSAAHLNHTYIPKQKISTVTINGNEITRIVTDDTTYKSKSLCLLFVDLLFLIVFGILVVFITRATDSVSVLVGIAILFIAAGFIWSSLALFRTNQRAIAQKWLLVDGVQILFTVGIIYLLSDELAQAVILGILYLIFLFADLYFIVRWTS